MRLIHVLALTSVAVLASLSWALDPDPQKETGRTGDSIAETAIILDHVWLDAARNRDTVTMAWLFADDFVEMHPSGEIVNGQQQIDQIKDPNRQLVELHPDNIQVRYASPDVAVLTETTTNRGSSGVMKFDDQNRAIRVFVKENGRWRAAGAGFTHITTQ